MGARALPAVAVGGGLSDVVGILRALVRSGDVIVVVSSNREDERDLLQRAPSWGATTIVLGAGVRPPPGAGDHVLWVGGDATFAAHDGRLVLAYHLLWELTHVCFEHPGFLLAPPAPESPTCITCSDEGRLGEVVHGGFDTATVRTASGTEEIDTTLVGPLVPGALVLVHAGIALTVVEGCR